MTHIKKTKNKNENTQHSPIYDYLFFFYRTTNQYVRRWYPTLAYVLKNQYAPVRRYVHWTSDGHPARNKNTFQSQR